MEFNLVILLLLILSATNFQTLEGAVEDRMWHRAYQRRITDILYEDGFSQQGCSKETIILQLNLNLTEDSELSEPWITWMNERGDIVHEYWAFQDYNENQDERFKGRTSLFEEEIKKGNVSLKIRDATIIDAGIYICEVSRNLSSPPERFYISLYCSITAEEGATVILPVKVDLPENLMLLNPIITWKTDKNIVVHQFRGYFNHNEDQDKRFKYRTSLFWEGIKKGDISLKIERITKNDEGIYIYEVHYQNLKLKKTGIVSLRVKEKREDPSPNLKHPSQNLGQTIGIVIAALFALVLKSYLYQKCR